MKRLSHIMTFALGILVSSSVFAHPGHDHSHWSSSLVHTAILLTAAVAISLVARYVSQNKTSAAPVRVKSKRDQH